MIWLAMAALALVTVAPVAWLGWAGSRLRNRRDAALALHRAQLTELDRDLADGRIMAEEHAAARLEVQRRLLADAALEEAGAGSAARWPVLMAAGLIPLAALALYLTNGHPGFPPPAAPAADTQLQADADKEDAVIAQLRNRLSLMDPDNERTLEGYTILGQAELKRGHAQAAADAWGHVLAKHFDPTLGVETAEILAELAGHTTPEAAALFRRSLAAAPPDAPWRPIAEKRLLEAGGS
jgi:cytochrome c-type biogenesis protein CcmH